MLPLNPTWLIMGEIEYSAEFNLESLVNCLKNNSCDVDQSIIALNETDRRKLWQTREHIPLAEKQHGYAAKHDISLPLSQIEAFLAINMPKLKKLVPNGYFSIFGHLGDGNLHYNFGLANIEQSQLTKLEEIVSPIVYEDVINLGGSISAEHGIGQSKKDWLVKFQPAPNYQILSGLKQYFDPQNIFNPGKVLD
jgi:FAD/FMN-containing dehydrogenase